MGLKQDLIDAKMVAENMRRKDMGLKPLITGEEPESLKEEARLTRIAIINFLTNEDLVWTINKFKASVELEELTTDELEAEVKTDVNTTVTKITGTPTPSGGGITPGTGTGTGTGTGVGTVSEGLEMRRDGKAKHGGSLKAVGYAYIGSDKSGNKEVDGIDNVPSENRETEVRLDLDRIADHLF